MTTKPALSAARILFLWIVSAPPLEHGNLIKRSFTDNLLVCNFEASATTDETRAPRPVPSGVVIMTVSSRRFLIAQDGVVYRLADATFTRMLRNPGSHAIPLLAGQRVRMASLIIGLIGGVPTQVVRSTFATLSFDDDGRMDSGMFTRPTGSGFPTLSTR